MGPNPKVPKLARVQRTVKLDLRRFNAVLANDSQFPPPVDSVILTIPALSGELFDPEVDAMLEGDIPSAMLEAAKDSALRAFNRGILGAMLGEATSPARDC